MISSLSIAVRYGSVRKQFGSKPGQESPIIEYQLHVIKKFYKKFITFFFYINSLKF